MTFLVVDSEDRNDSYKVIAWDRHTYYPIANFPASLQNSSTPFVDARNCARVLAEQLEQASN